MKETGSDLIIELSNVDRENIAQVGKEAARFGEIAALGIPIPKGFIITANAYHEFLLANREIPQDLVKEIFRAYKNLDNPLKDANVVVSAPFSKKRFKNVKGEANLMQKIKHLWEMYSDGIPAVLVYKIPESKQLGTMVTIDPIRNDKKIIVISEGFVSPNQYDVSKDDLIIINKAIKKGSFQKLADREIIDLARWGKKLQDHYYFPQEVHFLVDNGGVRITRSKPITTFGPKYLTEDWMQEIGKTSPVGQGHIPKSRISIRKVLARGNSIHPGIATGYLRIIRRPQDIHKLTTGDIAIITNPKNLRLNEVTRKARAVVIESRFHHLPHHSFPRVLGKPMIITMPNASKGLKEGLVATINGTNGEIYL